MGNTFRRVSVLFETRISLAFHQRRRRATHSPKVGTFRSPVTFLSFSDVHSTFVTVRR